MELSRQAKNRRHSQHHHGKETSVAAAGGSKLRNFLAGQCRSGEVRGAVERRTQQEPGHRNDCPDLDHRLEGHRQQHAVAVHAAVDMPGAEQQCEQTEGHPYDGGNHRRVNVIAVGQ